MNNLTVKKGENGKYGFVDDAGNWVIEPKLLKAFVWNELGVVHFEEKSDEGNIYDGWTIFKLDDPAEYNQRSDETGMGGDFGWYDHMADLDEDDDPAYLEAWNECDGDDWVRIYPDGEILAADEIEDEEDEDQEDDDVVDWDDEDWSVGGDANYGFIDRTGEVVIEAQFDDAGDFHDGLAWVEVDGKYGYINKNGKYIVEPKYEDARDFHEGLAWIQKDGSYGVINQKGKIVVPCSAIIDEVDNFNGGLARIQIMTGEYRFIDKTGKTFNYNNIIFHDGLAIVKINDKCGFSDKSGAVVIEPQFEEAEPFSDGLARVMIDGKYGFIDTTGNFIIKPQYVESEVGNFHEGLAWIQVDGEFGFIDKTGVCVIAPQFDSAFDFHDGLARVEDCEGYGFIDRTGTIVIKAKFSDVCDFHDGLAKVSLSDPWDDEEDDDEEDDDE